MSIKPIVSILSAALLLTLILTTSQQAWGAEKNLNQLFRFPTDRVSEHQIQLWNRNNRKRSDSKGLPSNNILTLKKVKNLLYIGLPSGLSVYNTNTKNLHTYTVADHLGENLVTTIGVDAEETVWVGGANSLSRVIGNNIVDYSEKTLFQDIRVISNYEDKLKQMWLLTMNGVYLKDAKGKWVVEKDALPGTLNDLIMDHNGDMWGAGNALFYFPLSTLSLKSLDKDRWISYLPLDANRVNITALALDSANILWIGTAARGLFSYDIDKQIWDHDSTTISDSITNMQAGSNGDLWVGTTGGLWKKEDGVWLELGEENNVPTETITALLLDPDDQTIWIGTPSGLIHITSKVVETITVDGVKRRQLTLDQQQTENLRKAELIRQKEALQVAKEEQDEVNKALGGTFKDLQRPDRYWIRDVVIPLKDKGIFDAKQLFKPEDPILWEQLIKLGLVAEGQSLAGLPEDFAPSTRIPANNWSIKYMWRATKDEIITPQDIDTYFEKPVKRMQALELLFKIFKIDPDESLKTTEFQDVPIVKVQLVETAVKYGFVKGFSEKQQLTIKAKEKYRLVDRLLTSKSVGSNVEEVQKVLQELGYYEGPISGIYSLETIHGVARYQVDEGIFTQRQADAGTAEGIGAYGGVTRSRLQEELLSTGVGDEVKKYFKPNDIFSRAQMAKVIQSILEWKAKGRPTD
jgi:hypothetical protein